MFYALNLMIEISQYMAKYQDKRRLLAKPIDDLSFLPMIFVISIKFRSRILMFADIFPVAVNCRQAYLNP
jgi:hypothetical protein